MSVFKGFMYCIRFFCVYNYLLRSIRLFTCCLSAKSITELGYAPVDRVPLIHSSYEMNLTLHNDILHPFRIT